MGRVKTYVSVNTSNLCNMSKFVSYWSMFWVIKNENPRLPLNEFYFKQYSYELTNNKQTYTSLDLLLNRLHSTP
jgi:hypothetical protein